MSGFTLPTSRRITQPWAAEFDDWDGDGTVDFPGGFYHSIGWDGHNGIDYGCYIGDPIVAVADGVVAFAGDAGNWHTILSGGGKAVLIEHPQYEVQTEYLHLSSWLVTAGQAVSKGQVIAYSGDTGAATAPHLHLGMLRLHGYNLNDRMRGRINPTPYLYGGTIQPAAETITPVQEDDDMAQVPQDEWEEIRDAVRDLAAKPAPQQLVVFKRKSSPICYIGQGMEYREIKSLDTLYGIQWAARNGWLSVKNNGQVQIFDDVYILGIDAYAKVK